MGVLEVGNDSSSVLFFSYFSSPVSSFSGFFFFFFYLLLLLLLLCLILLCFLFIFYFYSSPPPSTPSSTSSSFFPSSSSPYSSPQDVGLRGTLEVFLLLLKGNFCLTHSATLVFTRPSALLWPSARPPACTHAGCGPAALPEETPSESHVANDILKELWKALFWLFLHMSVWRFDGKLNR